MYWLLHNPCTHLLKHLKALEDEGIGGQNVSYQFSTHMKFLFFILLSLKPSSLRLQCELQFILQFCVPEGGSAGNIGGSHSNIDKLGDSCQPKEKAYSMCLLDPCCKMYPVEKFNEKNNNYRRAV